MISWENAATLATGFGTLVLAVATFSSVRAANRSVRVSEQALRLSNRPLLISSHIYDPTEKLRFRGSPYIKLPGGHAYAAVTNDVIYFAISVRNIGSGTAVLDSWSFSSDVEQISEVGDTDKFRRLTRDIYIPASGVGYWQGTIRDIKDSQFKLAAACIRKRQEMVLRIKYCDLEGRQPTVTLFVISPSNRTDDWLTAAGRHWRLDGQDPRSR